MSSKDSEVKEVKYARGQYLYNQQTETYRQQLAKESRALKEKTRRDFQKLDPYFSLNNSCMAFYRKDEGSSLNDSFKIDALDDEKFYKALPFHQDSVNEYCQKCKKDKGFCTHKLQKTVPAKEVLKFPLISSQAYGWKEPIDDLRLKIGLRNFPESPPTKLNLRQNTPKRDKKVQPQTNLSL